MSEARISIRKLASEVARREGKKSQARIGDIREIIKILCEMEAEDMIANPTLGSYVVGAIAERAKVLVERAKRKRKKSKK